MFCLSSKALVRHRARDSPRAESNRHLLGQSVLSRMESLVGRSALLPQPHWVPRLLIVAASRRAHTTGRSNDCSGRHLLVSDHRRMVGRGQATHAVSAPRRFYSSPTVPLCMCGFRPTHGAGVLESPFPLSGCVSNVASRDPSVCIHLYGRAVLIPFGGLEFRLGAPEKSGRPAMPTSATPLWPARCVPRTWTYGSPALKRFAWLYSRLQPAQVVPKRF